MGEPQWLTQEEEDAWRVYLRASRELDQALDRDLHPYGLSLTEYEILSMTSEAPGGRIRMSALAELVVQSRSRVTHTSARLEGRGWVRRQPAPDDGRGVLLTITPEGRTLLKQVAPVHVESVRRHLVDLLTQQQLDALHGAMTTVKDAALSTPNGSLVAFA